MKMKERTKLILERRIAGESYQSIASVFGVRVQTARMACLRAMWKGVVTPEQIRYAHTQKALSDEAYDALWLSRLASKSVAMPNGCIEVPGVFHNEDGYAIAHHRKLGQFAHHVIVIVKGRPIPPGYMSCHRCGNHACVNDDHLYVGTMKDNAQDTVAMGRHMEKQKTHCKHGHEFTPENTLLVGPRLNKRQCRTCNRLRAIEDKKSGAAAERQRRMRARRRAERESHPT